MDAETIKREASAALDDLEIDSTVGDVTHSGENWCVQFSSDYGRFCDSFQNQFKRDNSPRVVREKIKKHLLAQVTQLRNKGGRRTTKKGFGEEAQPDVGGLVADAIGQTSRAIGQAIDRTLGFTAESIDAAGGFAETLGTGTRDMLRSAARPVAEQSQPALGNLAREDTPAKSRKRASPSSRTEKAAAKTKRAAARKKTAGKAKAKKGQKVKKGRG